MLVAYQVEFSLQVTRYHDTEYVIYTCIHTYTCIYTCIYIYTIAHEFPVYYFHGNIFILKKNNSYEKSVWDLCKYFIMWQNDNQAVEDLHNTAEFYRLLLCIHAYMYPLVSTTRLASNVDNGCWHPNCWDRLTETWPKGLFLISLCGQYSLCNQWIHILVSHKCPHQHVYMHVIGLKGLLQ